MSPGYFERHFESLSHLMVRECEGTNLWTVERLRGGRRHQDVDDVLVHIFIWINPNVHAVLSSRNVPR